MPQLFEDRSGNRGAGGQSGEPGVHGEQFLPPGRLHPALGVAAEGLGHKFAPLGVDQGEKRGDFRRGGLGDRLKSIDPQDLRSDRVGEDLCRGHAHAQPGE